MAAPAPAMAPAAVRVVLVDDAGRVLVLLRPAGAAVYPNHWCLPGGQVDAGEAGAAAAARELREETGLTADFTGIEAGYRYPGGVGRAFLARYPAGEQRFPAAEVAEARWVAPNDLPSPMMPEHAALVRQLAGAGDRAMRDLDLTPRRRQLEAAAAEAIAPWLKAMVLELAGLMLGDRLTKALAPDDPDYQFVMARFRANEAADRTRVARVHEALDTDGLGEGAFLRVLTRAVKAGRAEAARAIMLDARRGALPPGQRGYREKTMAGLAQIARRHLRQVCASTERRLSLIAMQPEAADVQTLLAKLYDTYRGELIGLNLVAEGYVNGVADVLRDYGYKHVWARTMADDRVCPQCRHFETTPALAKMTIQQFLRRFPLHPRCRCWPAPSPTAAIADMHWRDPRARVLAKGWKPMHALAELAALVADDPLEKGNPQVDAALLREIAGKRNRVGGKFAPGKVTADDPKAAPRAKKADAPPAKGKGGATASDLLKRAGTAAKAEQAKPAKPKPGGGGGGAAGGAINTKSPDHLLKTGHALRAQLAQLEPGSDEHAHVLTQYNAIRASVKTWNASKGATANPGDGVVDGGNVKVGDPPAFLGGGADKLRTPRQFEIAATQAETREDAIELAHYFERLAHNNGHAGQAWDAAWAEIKGAIKALPTKAQAAAGVDGKGKPLPAKAPELAPGLEAQKASEEYHGHLDELNGHSDRMAKVGATKAEKDAAHRDYIGKLDEIASKTGKRAIDIVADSSRRRTALAEAKGAQQFEAAEPGKGEGKGAKKKAKPAAAAEPEGGTEPGPEPGAEHTIATVAGAAGATDDQDAPAPAPAPKASPEATRKPAPGAERPAAGGKGRSPDKPKPAPGAGDRPARPGKGEAKAHGKRILGAVMDHFGTVMRERHSEHLEK